jgi:hypothetical protein
VVIGLPSNKLAATAGLWLAIIRYYKVLRLKTDRNWSFIRDVFHIPVTALQVKHHFDDITSILFYETLQYLIYLFYFLSILESTIVRLNRMLPYSRR